MAAADLSRDYDDVVEHYRARLAAALGASSGSNDGPTEASASTPDESGLRQSLIVTRLARSPEETLENLTVGQATLRGRIAWAMADLDRLPRDPSSVAAFKTVASRLSDVADVRDALDEMIAALATTACPPRGAASPVVMYLEGVQRWAMATTDELSALAYALVELTASWPEVRQRLALAKAEWPTELLPAVLEELTVTDDGSALGEVSATFEDLSFALRVLDENLQQRFG